MKEQIITPAPTDTKELALWWLDVLEHFRKYLPSILWDYKRNSFWVYDYGNNKWVRRTFDKRDAGTEMWIEMFAFLKEAGVKGAFLNRHKIEQELDKLKALLVSENNVLHHNQPYPRYHNFLNGIYDIKENKFYKHTDGGTDKPEMFTDYQYQFDVEPEILTSIEHDTNITDKFDGELKKLFWGATTPEDRKGVLLSLSQMFGTAIAPTRFQVMYILIGMQGTAKSTMLKALESLMGSERVAHPQLEKYAGKSNDAVRFGKASAVEKLITISEEISEQGIDVDILKTLITENKQSVEYKGRNIFDVEIQTRFYGTSNNVLYFDGSTEGIERRMKYIVLQRQIPYDEIDLELIDKIQNNPNHLRNLFYFALQGYRSILYNKDKHMDDKHWEAGFFQTDEALYAREEIRAMARPVHVFLDEIEFSYGGEAEKLISSTGLWKAYINWAIAQGHTQSSKISQLKFNQQVREYLTHKFNIPVQELKKIVFTKRVMNTSMRVWSPAISANEEILSTYEDWDYNVLV